MSRTVPSTRASAAALVLLLISAACTSGSPATAGAQASRIDAMTTKTVPVSEDYHGTPIADPYRWLEDPASPETKAWIAAENERTFGFLRSLPEREAIEARLTELWNYPRFGPPSRRGTRWFFSKNDGLQNQAVVYWSEGREGAPKVLIDPNGLSPDGTVSLADLRLSEDGRFVAYGISSGGSDWNTWRVRDVETGVDLPDELRWVKFSSVAWLPDHSGFYYARYPEPAAGEAMTAANRDHKLYFHRVGTAQAEDALVYERPDQPDWGFGCEVTEDGRYLVIPAWLGTDSRNRVFYLDLASDAGVRPLLTDFDASYDFIGNDGPLFFFKTDQGASRLRVIAVDVRAPGKGQWKEIVPESSDTLSEVRLVAERLLLVYLQDVHHRMEVRERSGAFVTGIALPALGSVSSLTGRRADPEAFFAFTTFNLPSTIYRYDVGEGRLSAFREPPLRFDPTAYEISQEWYASKDGTRIPMFLVRKKGVVPNGDQPVLLYGYGGFNIPILPAFSVSNLVWLERGGVYAQPALRGGGEYGEAWHRAGMHERKQNVFDDFVAAAEWLVREKWTRASRIAISGGSNGGLLVGACMVQRPELFGACLPAVGVMDMLRFHQFTIGWAWTTEYGSADDPQQFRTLLAYSPLHNLKAGTRYPATLITTADHDDRVVPAHSFKFAAALQAAQAADVPTLIRIETRAGHGAGVPTSKLIEEAADKLAFLSATIGH